MVPAGAALMLGIALRGIGKHNTILIRRREAYLTVSVSWAIICLLGSLPYLLSGSIPGFIDAFFESASGFTTTGSSILTDIEALPHSILFWRSMTHWIGGIGIIVIVILVMPTMHIGGYHLFTLESSLQDRIQPRIKAVGIRLLLIYLGLTILEILFLLPGGMSLFESVCHTFGTVSTGGFSPKNSSIGEYSPYIQYVIMAFMVLSGTNFVIHYYLLKGEIRKIKVNDELKFYLLVMGLFGLIVSIILFTKMGKPAEEAFREGFFQVVSIITCTGYATADYLLWPEYAWTLIFMAMFIGGCTGSTSGGIKMVRHLVALKNLANSFRQILHPKAILNVRLNKKSLAQESNSSILTFIVLYFLTFLAGSVMLMLTGIDGKTATSAIASCMANIGPGIGTIGPVSNFAHLPEIDKLLLVFFMLLGRLEIYTILVLFTRDFWRK